MTGVALFEPRCEKSHPPPLRVDIKRDEEIVRVPWHGMAGVRRARG